MNLAVCSFSHCVMNEFFLGFAVLNPVRYFRRQNVTCISDKNYTFVLENEAAFEWWCIA